MCSDCHSQTWKILVDFFFERGGGVIDNVKILACIFQIPDIQFWCQSMMVIMRAEGKTIKKKDKSRAKYLGLKQLCYFRFRWWMAVRYWLQHHLVWSGWSIADTRTFKGSVIWSVGTPHIPFLVIDKEIASTLNNYY